MFLPVLYCTARFVRKEDIQRISKDYEKVYALKERVEVGNFDSLNKGAKVKIYFKTAGEYISIYAYPHSQPREEAVGKNIMQIFEGDFPDKKFSETLFREKLATLFEEYTGKLDKISGDQGLIVRQAAKWVSMCAPMRCRVKISNALPASVAGCVCRSARAVF